MNSIFYTSELLEFRLDDSAAAARWDELLSGFPAADAYHRAAYVLASAELEHSQPVGLMISFGGLRFMVPALLRRIKGPDGQSWTDGSTPYGYGGVLCSSLDSEVGLTGVVGFFKRLRSWCEIRNLVCYVVRSHPLLAQNWLFAEAPDIDFVTNTSRRPTVALPLQRWDDTMRCPLGLSKGRRSDLAFARRNLRVTWNTISDHQNALEQLGIFRVLYENTMQCINAAEFFRFPPSYYEHLSALGPDVGIAIAWSGDCAVGGAVFIAGRTFAHYHLSASNDIGYKHKAPTLLVVEGANWARQRGSRALHLGGGMHVNDSLMEFKRRFGGKNYQFGNVILITDRERYSSMCSYNGGRWPYDQQMAVVSHMSA
jgi:Acetyltransferase (GNAT) domain